MSTTKRGLWLRSYHPAPDAARNLLCFPHAGGSAGFFFAWSQELAPARDVRAVQYPGRQDRLDEPLVDSVDEIADRVHAAAAEWIAERPTVLFGHSMGAAVAYEVARRAPVAALVVSGRRAPSAVREEFVHLGDDDALVAEVRTLGAAGTDLLDEPELRAMFLPALRSDYRAIETYQVSPRHTRVAAPITVLTGAADDRVTAAEASAWAEHTTAGCTVETFSGGHFFLEEHRTEILDRVTEL